MKIALSFYIALICALIPVAHSQDMVISEFVASNSSTLVDGDGEYSDWIEIYNAGADAININGWYLTDDLSDLTLWQFPPADVVDLTIEPSGTLLVFASGKGDSTTPYIDELFYLHASFKLNGEGEDLALVKSDGETIAYQYEDFPKQYLDISYGLNDGQEGFFITPTPDAMNSALYEGLVGDTNFSVDRGFFDEPFILEITTKTEGAVIRFTVDGSEPSLMNGNTYTAPLTIEKTTTLRAAAFKDGYLTNDIDTQTYFFLSDIITQSQDGSAPNSDWPSPSTSSTGGRPGGPGGPGSGGTQAINYGMDPDVTTDDRYKDLMNDAMLAIPSLSIVTDLDNLFSTQTGIYMNAEEDGEEWERPISLELINPDGEDGFQVNAGLRIRGGVSRSPSNPKHNFRMFFRSEYGDATLNYPLFGDEGVDVFDKIDLRTGQNFSWHMSQGGDATNSTWLYDVYTRDAQRDMGHPYTRSRFYHLYINGQYWGLYQTEERPEANFSASYMGGDEEEYDVVKSDNDSDGSVYATDGNLEAYQELWTAVSSGLQDNEDYFRIQGLNADGLTVNPDSSKLLDVDNLIDFMILIYYTGNRDCPLGPPGSMSQPRNMFASYNRKNPDGFKFITHDSEHTLGVHLSQGVNYNYVDVNLGSKLGLKNYCNPWWLHVQMLEDNAEYRLRFADRLYKHFFNNGALSAQVSADRFNARKSEIELAVIGESARWGDYTSANSPRTKDDDWLPIVNRILDDYILAEPSTRTEVVFNQIKAMGWYPDVEPPVLNQFGGEFAAGFELTFTSNEGEIYYTLDGGDPRLLGGSLIDDAVLYTGEPIVLTHSAQVQARVLSNGEWSPLADAMFQLAQPNSEYLRITEMHYNPIGASDDEFSLGFDDGDDFEFIELFNSSGELTIDLSNVNFDDGIEFTFPSGASSSIGPNEVIVLVSNQDAFAARYGTEISVFAEYDGQLNNGGENVRLMNADGDALIEYEYGDEEPWPEEADGDGPSLQVIDVNGDYADPSNWKASEFVNGSPGVVEGIDTAIYDWFLY